MEVNRNESNDLHGVKIIGIPKLIFLAIITFGVYPSVWFHTRRQYFNGLVAKEKIAPFMTIGLVVISCIGVSMSLMSGLFEIYGVIIDDKESLELVRSLDTLNIIATL